MCDKNFTVTYAHYCQDRLPEFKGEELSAFRDKYMFGVGMKLPNMGSVIGVCTDICVVSNVLLTKAFSPETEVSVCAKCCAGTSAAAHEAALLTMRSCQAQIE